MNNYDMHNLLKVDRDEADRKAIVEFLSTPHKFVQKLKPGKAFNIQKTQMRGRVKESRSGRPWGGC